MDRTKALAVVCLFLVLVGGSISLALADSSGNAANPSEQITAPSERTQPVVIELLPEEDSILRDQSTTFVVRVVSDGEDGLLLGLRLGSDGPASFEFHDPDVRILAQSWLYPQFDVVGYIPADAVEPDEAVPVTISPEETFAVGTSSIEVTKLSRDPKQMATAKFQLEIRCPVGCQTEVLTNRIVRSPELVIGFLSLLVAFFGRKKIWTALQAPRVRFAGITRGKPRCQGEDDREME